MTTTKISGKMKQKKNKSNLTIVLNLTKEQMNEFLLERGEQPKGMFKVIVKEGAK